jgi:hypothetical protein
MKTRFTIFALFTLFLSSIGVVAAPGLALAESRPAYVYILGGQSNAGGFGANWSDLTPADQAVLSHKIAGSYFIDYKEPTIEGGVEVYRWKGMGPRSDGHFGAEIGFAAEMRKRPPAETVYVIKVTVGGTSIDRWLDPNDLWAAFATTVEAGLSQIKEPYILGGMAWIQDGADSHTEEDATSYQADTENFIARVRSYLKAPTLRVVLVEEPNYTDEMAAALPPETVAQLIASHPYIGIIHKAKLAIVEEDPYTHYLDTTGYTFADDHVHFDTKSQLRLGRSLAQMFNRTQD